MWIADPGGGKAVNLRDYARGQDCQVRLVGICNFNAETTVLAHVRQHTGIAQKAPDLLGAWACSACHLAVDSDRSHRLDFLEGILRTQAILINKGKVKW
jgi:hypothetical protein